MLGTSINSYDLGAVVLIFFIAAGLLKLLTYVVKQRFEEKSKEPCKAFENKACPIADRWGELEKLVTKIYDIHCGTQAINGKTGTPRWYFQERFDTKLDGMREIVDKIHSLCSSHHQDTREFNIQTIEKILDLAEKLKGKDTKKVSKVQIKDNPT